MKRLFIAIDISDVAREIAAAHIKTLQREFQHIRTNWVQPKNLHITLKFLGDTKEELLPDLYKKIDSIANNFSEFTLTLDRCRTFGKRILIIDLENMGREVFRLEKLLDSGCGSLGFPREERQFKPHLTIARIRDPLSANALIKQHNQAQIEPVEFDVREIVLYESELGSTGSTYNKMGVFPLKIN
jgi:RNA 2',3'-cyclic 3'-phosphodiesterase